MNVNMSFFFTSKKKKEKKKLTDVLLIIVNKLFYENFDVTFIEKKNYQFFLYSIKKSL